MLQISPTVYINPFMLDAVLSKQREDTLYTSTEGILHREGPTTAQLAANGFFSNSLPSNISGLPPELTGGVEYEPISAEE